MTADTDMTDDTAFRRGQQRTFEAVHEAIEDAERELTWATGAMGETTNAVMAVVRAKLRALEDAIDAEWDA